MADVRRARLAERAASGGALRDIDDVANSYGGTAEQAMLQFARELGQRLNQARSEQRYDCLCLIAAPAFLGLLRGHLDKDTLKLLRAEIAMDIAGFALQDMEECVSQLAPCLGPLPP